jgi:lipopolysaccharide export LptBFGC system permease protein LptF
MNKKIYFYIAKKFLLVFLIVVFSIALLIAMVNIFELLGKIEDKDISFAQIVMLDLLQLPELLENLAIFLIMLSSMITLFSLSVRSEISVMRASTLSFLNVVTPIALSAFGIGLLIIFVLNPMTISASKKFNKMQKVLIDEEEPSILAPIGGIW